MAIGGVISTSSLTLTFDDEFNTFSASADGSTGLWRTTLANGNRTLATNGEQEYYSDGSVGVNPFSIQNGALDITAAPGSNTLNLPYNSGVITTQNSFSQLYGYFEIDAKLPAGQGLWPAFWLLPASGAWPPELDVFEVLGNNPTTLYFSTHSTVQATQGTTLSVANVSSGYNLYGVMWGPQTVDLYINNVEVASMKTPADMNVPMYMVANLAVGGYWPGNANSTTKFPANMYINYVRAYSYPGTTGGTVYDTSPSRNVGSAALAPVISAPAAVTAPVGAATALSGVSVAANWPGGFFTVVLSDSTGLLNTSATADVFTSGEGTKSLTLTGNLPAVNSALGTLTYRGSSIGGEWIWINATDPQGLQSQKSVVATDVASTTPVVAMPPVAPVVTIPAAMTLAAGATAALTGISVADSQSSGAFTIRVSDSTGLLSATATAGVTTQGQGTTSLALTGTLAAIDTELATLTYHAGAAVGGDWVWVSADDATGRQGLGHEVVTVTSAPVVTPVVTIPAAMTLAMGATAALTGISVADSQSSGVFTVRVSDGAGLLSATATAGVTMQGQGTTSLALTGTLAAIDAELKSMTYHADSAGADWLWVSANDATGHQGLGHEVVTATPGAVSNTLARLVQAMASLPGAASLQTTGIASAAAVNDAASVASNPLHAS